MLTRARILRSEGSIRCTSFALNDYTLIRVACWYFVASWSWCFFILIKIFPFWIPNFIWVLKAEVWLTEEIKRGKFNLYCPGPGLLFPFSAKIDDPLGPVPILLIHIIRFLLEGRQACFNGFDSNQIVISSWSGDASWV
jgi:hypothetical protein